MKVAAGFNFKETIAHIFLYAEKKDVNEQRTTKKKIISLDILLFLFSSCIIIFSGYFFNGFFLNLFWLFSVYFWHEYETHHFEILPTSNFIAYVTVYETGPFDP